MVAAAALRAASILPDAIGLYLHYPLCVSLCAMCAFVKQRASTLHDHAGLHSALLADASHALRFRTSSRRVATVYMGGGTPALAPASLVAGLLDTVARDAEPLPGLEVTVEGTPASFTPAKLADLRAAGATRISLGVQSLDASALRLLGREHTPQEAVDAARRARAAFPQPYRLSVDLIYGRPGQTVASWREELRRAAEACEPDQISAYQLTVEPGTPFARDVAAGRVRMPSPELQEDLYFATVAELASLGFEQAEVSTFVRCGISPCEHNVGYWTGRDHVGIGPGAHGRFVDAAGRRWRTRSAADAASWTDMVRRDGHGVARTVAVDAEGSRDEAVVMGLRMLRGLAEGGLRRFMRSDLAFEDCLDMDKVAELCDAGLMQLADEGGDRVLRLTPKGLPLSDSIVPDILLPMRQAAVVEQPH
ncbi:coproporphyrinogen III oxidase [Hyaloraphidium curvatum]|nr:coproporphyrinogen III oxidase [Hyaloraphidium curvatum]